MDDAKIYRCYEEQDANADDRVPFTLALAVTFIIALIVGYLIGIASVAGA